MKPALTLGKTVWLGHAASIALLGVVTNLLGGIRRLGKSVSLQAVEPGPGIVRPDARQAIGLQFDPDRDRIRFCRADLSTAQARPSACA